MSTLPKTLQLTAHQSAMTALRRAILSGELEGGRRLVQTDIADQLGLSITPVREALRQLATEGLLRFDSYRGAVVHVPSTAELTEIHEMAAALIPLLATKAAEHVSDSDVASASAFHDVMLASRGDLPRWVDANREFHAAVYAAARSPRIEGVVASLGFVAAPLVAQQLRRDPGLVDVSNQEHAAILAAFVAGDAELLGRRCVDHLDLSLRPSS